MSYVRYTTDSTDVNVGYLVEDVLIEMPNITAEQIITEQPDPRMIVTEATEQLTRPQSSIELRSPIVPETVIRLEGCYQHDRTDSGFDPHVESVGMNDQEWPSLWAGPPSMLSSPWETVSIPPQIDDVRAGVELGLVVGEGLKTGTTRPEDALAGYVVCLSLAARDDHPGAEGYKMFDGFLPCGPRLVPASIESPDTLPLVLQVNGEPIDTRSTSDLFFSLEEILEYVSSVTTLQPGDLICTGSPIRGSPTLDDGDSVTGWIGNIGRFSVTLTRGGAG